MKIKEQGSHLTKSDLIWLIIMVLIILAPMPWIIDTLTEHDVYTCHNYKSPQQPDWCAQFLLEQEAKGEK